MLGARAPAFRRPVYPLGVRLLLLLLLLVGCSPTPPQRNPPPALSAPGRITLLAPADDPMVEVARVAVRRLNTSRSPTERPVVLEVRGRPEDVAPGERLAVVPVRVDAPPGALAFEPRRGPIPEGARHDPDLPPAVIADDGHLSEALAVYDAVVEAGLSVRSP